MRLKSSCNRRRHPSSPHKQKHPVSHNPAFRDNFFFSGQLWKQTLV